MHGTRGPHSGLITLPCLCPLQTLSAQEFEFVVSPTGRSQHLKLVLFAPSEQGQQYVAAGSLGLDSLLGSDTPHQRVSVPVVDEASGGRWVGCAASDSRSTAAHTPLLAWVLDCSATPTPAVVQVGKHAGEVDCTLCFPSRPPSAAGGDAAAEAGVAG